MRILSVRFKNLNSLIGEWEIDFRHPEYQETGLFAITGPTGAGKSTILDAICLALYGRTPRLNNLSKNSNELMSRLTGDCFSELIFEVPEGTYICTWSQHRSRKNPQGDLQAPKHEIANVSTGALLTDRLREVPHVVAEKSGLDYDRFTRSMLLAQGGFAAFLQAPPNERSPILEQITGTDIYSSISQHVHLKRKEEQETLRKINERLAMVQLLSPDEEQEALGQKQSLEVQLADLGRTLQTQQQTLEKLIEREQLAAKLTALNKQQAQWAQKQLDFEPQARALNAAILAHELEPLRQHFQVLKDAQEADENQQRTLELNTPTKQNELLMAQKLVEQAQADLTNSETNYERQIPLFRRVRDIDPHIAQIKQQLDQQHHELKKRLNIKDQLALRIDTSTRLATETQAQLEQKKQGEQANQHDALIAETLVPLALDYQRYQDLTQQANLTETLLQRLKKEDSQTQETKASIDKKLKQAYETLEHMNKEIQVAQSVLTDHLQGQDLDYRHHRLMELHSRLNALEKYAMVFDQQDKINHQYQDNQNHLETLAKQSEACELDLATKKQSFHRLQELMRSLDAQYQLGLTLQSFEEARRQLTDDSPCPLCGSKTHPYVTEQPHGDLNGLDAQREQARQAADTEQAAMTQLEGTLTGLTLHQQQLSEYQSRLKTELQHVSDQLLALQASLGNQVPTSSLEIVHEIESTRQTYQTWQQAITQAQTQQQLIDQQLNDAQTQAHRVKDLEHERTLTHERSEQLKQQIHEAQENLTHHLSHQQTHLTKIRVCFTQHQLPKDIDVAIGIEQLTLRAQAWSELTVAIQQATQTLEQHTHSLGFLTQEYRERSDEIAELTERISQRQEELNTLKQERHDLLQDQCVDTLENAWTQTIHQQRKKCDESREFMNKKHAELNQHQQNILGLIQQQAKRNIQLTDTHEELITQAKERGFVDLSSLEAARLPAHTRQALTEQASVLATEATRLDTLKRDYEAQQAMNGQDDIPHDQHEWRTFIANTQSAQSQCQQTLGSIIEKLKQQAHHQQYYVDLLKEQARQQTETQRWDALHQLIGSEDGRKYRNFVQNLTFEHLINHANRQLSKMMDRYLLVSDPKESLEFAVIDQYQANEIRSSKNLSGGESFMISLALALGLSNMVSHTIRVDSLFLDEGFGTLDEEALDIALTTLSQLQHEGKLIGVISHVHALKDRITTQIKVRPKTGGRSTLSGPGVTHR